MISSIFQTTLIFLKLLSFVINITKQLGLLYLTLIKFVTGINIDSNTPDS